ncbi:hypothetical protein CEXT_690761 [Caerostris extrusa]|uniref:Uncharacterized protein n=1 Tax=Caerostris extrusa TaxID=172846 RepID=A0AAV4Y7M3_CAEEX|nr:hypothetical protein CEXT_690761 [Caerostris extrusa]
MRDIMTRKRTAHRLRTGMDRLSSRSLLVEITSIASRPQGWPPPSAADGEVERHLDAEDADEAGEEVGGHHRQRERDLLFLLFSFRFFFLSFQVANGCRVT